MKKRFLAVILSAVLCLSMTACNKGSGKNTNNTASGGSTAATDTITPDEEHLVDESLRLHKVTLTDRGRAFIANGECEYKIVTPAGANSYLRTAASFIRVHLLGATDCALDIIEDDGVQWSADSKYLVLGSARLLAAAQVAGPETLSDDIGQTGYYFTTVGNTVFVQVKEVFGWQNAAIAFLRAVVGYDMIAADTVVYEKDGSKLPDMEIVEKPDFEFAIPGDSMSGDARYGMGFMRASEIYIPVGGKTYHNSFKYLPPETYRASHPDWYSTTFDQLCYTAHGNEREYNAMTQAVAARVIDALEDSPGVNNVTFTQEDSPTQCGCDACNRIMDTYGNISAAILQFCNRVDDIVQQYLENKAQNAGTAKREFNILFFAYHRSEKAPAVQGADGTYTAINNIHCNEHVGVLIAPIRSPFNQSFYHENNIATADTINGWAVVCDKLYMWLYQTNFNHYFFPLNSYDTMIESYRFCKSAGAFLMYNQGQYNQGSVTHFSRLKEYFDSVATFDVNANTAEITDKFFKYYFDDAAVPMRTFYDEMVAHLRYMEEKYPADMGGTIRDNMEQQRLWPKRLLDGWLELVDEAYASIEHYRLENAKLYETLAEHIKLESIFPRWALLRLHNTSYTSSELRLAQTQFKKDCEDLGITRINEAGGISSVWGSWGIG